MSGVFLRYGGIALVSFVLGYGAASVSRHTSLESAPPSASIHTDTKNQNPMSALAIDIKPSADVSEVQQQVKQQYQQVKNLIETTSNAQLGRYLQQAFPDYSFEGIHNNQQFAQQMLDEFVQAKNDPQQQLLGRAYVTDQVQLDIQSILPREIYKTQPLYAHFDTLGKVPSHSQIMIRWTQRDSGEVLLFTPRKVSQNQQQNWVSFYPVSGWKPGHYDVKYYQMNDQLEPIAQTSFYIQNVIQ